MNKFIKILICNIALILFTLFCMEIYFFYKTYCWEVENKKKLSYLEYGNDKYFSTQEKVELIKYTFLSKYKNEGEFNDDMYRCIDCAQDKTNNKPPIVLLGCSFTHGFTLKNNQTFNAILNKITNRKVYNWGVMGASPREMLITLRKKHFVKDIEPPEYIIYTYISDHRRRLYSPLIDLKYKCL